MRGDVASKRCDAAIIDSISAAVTVGEGNEYETLGYDYPLSGEYFCVGVRKDSPLERKINEFFSFYRKNRTILTLAGKYGLRDALAVPEG